MEDESALGCLLVTVMSIFGAWFFGWLASLALAAAFDIHAPVWACAVLLFILSGIFSGGSRR